MAQLATHEREKALNIVQDTMFKLVQRYAQRPEAEWKPLFHKILHNGIRDCQRRNWVRTRWRVWFQSHSQEENEDHQASGESLPDRPTPDPATQLDQFRATKALDAALRRLPLHQGQAFLFRAWEELGLAQTAQAMECSAGSVKTHYSRAIHSLPQRLAESSDLIYDRT